MSSWCLTITFSRSVACLIHFLQVLVMGYGGTMSSWGVTLLHRLAQKRPVVIFDGPAQGQLEEVQPSEGALTPHALEEVFLGFLTALNLSRRMWLGGAWGRAQP